MIPKDKNIKILKMHWKSLVCLNKIEWNQIGIKEMIPNAVYLCIKMWILIKFLKQVLIKNSFLLNISLNIIIIK